MKVLITGAGGMTGAEVARQARAKGWDVTALTHAELDVTDSTEVDDAVQLSKPDVIVHAAAFTAVDRAETMPERAMDVNAGGARNIARAAQENRSAIIHISTDYVFDGKSSEAYRPDDEVGPINRYGESKLFGELGVREECQRHVIIRTSWVFSHEGSNFVRTMLRLAGERDHLKVVDDQHGRPTSAADLAAAILVVADAIWQTDKLSGTYHFCNAEPTTWFEFARAIFDIKGDAVTTLEPITTEQFPTPARRPRWSVLDTRSFETTFGVAPREWREALRDVMVSIS